VNYLWYAPTSTLARRSFARLRFHFTGHLVRNADHCVRTKNTLNCVNFAIKMSRSNSPSLCDCTTSQMKTHMQVPLNHSGNARLVRCIYKISEAYPHVVFHCSHVDSVSDLEVPSLSGILEHNLKELPVTHSISGVNGGLKRGLSRNQMLCVYTLDM